MSRSLRPAVAALVGVVLAASAARAQNSTAVAQAPNSVELGVDAGLTFGLGDKSSVDFNFPAQRARVGVFLNNESRISIEPAIAFNYNKTKDVPAVSTYQLEVGGLYHFAPPRRVAEVAAASRVAVTYVRPFIGFEGQSVGGSGGNDSEFYAGGGLGVKVPFRTNIAFRAEANLAYGFDNNAARLGALLGLSFFTRRGG